MYLHCSPNESTSRYLFACHWHCSAFNANTWQMFVKGNKVVQQQINKHYNQTLLTTFNNTKWAVMSQDLTARAIAHFYFYHQLHSLNTFTSKISKLATSCCKLKHAATFVGYIIYIYINIYIYTYIYNNFCSLFQQLSSSCFAIVLV